MPHERPPVRVFPVKGMRINVSTDLRQSTIHIVQYSTVQLICHRQGRKCVVRAAPEWAQ